MAGILLPCLAFGLVTHSQASLPTHVLLLQPCLQPHVHGLLFSCHWDVVHLLACYKGGQGLVVDDS